MNQQLLKRLQLVIKDLSVNSLTSIYPEQLVEVLGASQSDVKQLVDDMFEERMLFYKYRINCLCGNSCTLYMKKLQREPYICKDCEREYTIADINQKGILLYELVKEEIMNYDAEAVDFKEAACEKEKVVYIDRAQKQSREESNIMKIFLGSSSESIQDMEDIGYKLEQLGKKPILWNDAGKGIFVPNENTIDSLIRIAKTVDAAVFIFSAEDKVWHHKSLKESTKVRDNVLFEYGLFCGALGKEKVCFVCKGRPDLASDLNGITYIDGGMGDITIKKKLEDWLSAM